MKYWIQEGNTIAYAASGAAKSAGAVVAVGEIIGVVVNDIADGSSGPVAIRGVVKVTKVGSQAWAIGDQVFWDHTNSRFTKTASSDADQPAGVAYETAGSGAGVTTGYVLLLPHMCKKAASVADVATADGSDAATTQALANALKVKINALLAAMRVTGLLDN